jgi:membrane protein DedA with SNARE-associated domain/membrane-associated phospholipid phosphatase
MSHPLYLHITQWLHIHPQWGWVVAFLIAFTESIAIIGSIIPGSVTMTAVGILAGSGVLHFWPVFISGALGAMIGDGICYVLGYYLKDKIQNYWPFSRHPQLLNKGTFFLHKHGGKSVLIGRFAGPVRAIVPIIAGMLRFPPGRYFPISIFSAILWAFAYLLPGVLVGAVALELPTSLATELILFVLFMLVLIWLLAWLIHLAYRKTHHYIEIFLHQKWEQWTTQPSKCWLCYLLRYGDNPHHPGQLLMASMIIVLFGFFLFLALYIACHGSPNHWNNLIYYLLRGTRTPSLDKILIITMSLGTPQVAGPTLLISALVLILQKNRAAAYHLIAVCSASILIAYTLKTLIPSIRPTGILYQSPEYSFPSGHVTVAISLLGFLAFLIAHYLKPYFRHLIYGFTFFLCATVALSRLYLGAHWMTDVLGGSALALLSVCLGILSYRRHPRTCLKAVPLLITVVLSLTCFGGFYYHRHSQTLLYNAQPFWQEEKVLSHDWWTQHSSLTPVYRQDRLGVPSELLNLEWAGELTTIQSTLAYHGWKPMPSRDYLTTLINILSNQDQSHYSLIAKLYHDRSPVLELIKYPTQTSPPLILRLWTSDITLMPQQSPLWVGTVYFNYLPKRYFLIFHKHDKFLPLKNSTQYLAPELAGFDWQVRRVPHGRIPHRLLKIIPSDQVLLVQPHH